jgi:multiple sugar transport system substrate-binding protein
MIPTRRQVLIGAATALAMPAVRTSAAAPLTISISHAFPTYPEMMAKLAAGFAERNPGYAVRYPMAAENWDPLLEATLRGALVDDLPDGTHQALSYARVLVGRGIAKPLTGVDPAALGVPDALAGTLRVNGAVHALPFGTTIPVVYYNMDLLRKAGAAAPATTWDAVSTAAKAVAGLGGKVNGGYLEYTSTNAWMFQNLLTALGGRMMTADETDIAFDSPEGLAALEILARFGEAATSDMTLDQARQAFNAGATGVLVRTASGIASVAKAAQGRFELQVGGFPVPAASGRLVGAGHGTFMFAKDPARQRAVQAYMAFIAGTEAQAILAEFTGYLPVNTQLMHNETYVAKYLAEHPLHKGVLPQLAITGDYYSFPVANTVQIFDMIVEQMRLVLARRATPHAALAAMAEQSRKLLRRA